MAKSRATTNVGGSSKVVHLRNRNQAEVGHAAAARSSLSAPRMTIQSASSGTDRCNALASSHGARIQTSRSSSVVRITGMPFRWIGSTTAFGEKAIDRMRQGADPLLRRQHA